MKTNKLPFYRRVIRKFMYLTAPLWNDKAYLKVYFWSNLGYRLNLKNPRTFNEKLQWLKLYNRKPEYTKMVDKYEAKKYVASIIGEEYIIPTLGAWDRTEDIDFDKLSDKFVLKTTHDSGGVIICKDKATFDKRELKKLDKALKRNFIAYTREYPYKDVKPRIIAEQYMVDESGMELKDYKFFCFNGKVQFLKVDFDRFTKHGANYYDSEWNLLPFYEVVCPSNPSKIIGKSKCFNKMIEIAEKLSKGIPFVRVDLYDVNNKIYFGEITFFPNSGNGKFEPEEWDYKIGKWIELPTDRK